MKKIKIIIRLLCCIISINVFAHPPQVAIVIDDLGNNLYYDIQAVNLPGPVVASILPDTPFSTYIADRAHMLHKNVIMHVPMQPIAPHNLGPGALVTGMTQQQILTTLRQDIKTVPYAVGMSNHEGSLLTQKVKYMNWVMQFAKQQHIFFFDSRTIAATVAEKTAEADGVPTLARKIFLDDKLNQKYITKQFQLLVRDAKHDGYAIAIGHPHPSTIAVLQREIPKLKQEGIKLVRLTTLIKEYGHHNQFKSQPAL